MKTITLFANLNDESLEQLKSLDKSSLFVDLCKEAKIRIVHIFEVQVYTADFAPFIYPTEDKYPEISEASNAILKSVAAALIRTGVKEENIATECLFSHNPKSEAIDYLKQSNSSLAVVASKEKSGFEGLFHSSFAEYLNRHSPCDLYISRPRK